jgi:hypothetical protein
MQLSAVDEGLKKNDISPTHLRSCCTGPRQLQSIAYVP